MTEGYLKQLRIGQGRFLKTDQKAAALISSGYKYIIYMIYRILMGCQYYI